MGPGSPRTMDDRSLRSDDPAGRIRCAWVLVPRVHRRAVLGVHLCRADGRHQLPQPLLPRELACASNVLLAIAPCVLGRRAPLAAPGAGDSARMDAVLVPVPSRRGLLLCWNRKAPARLADPRAAARHLARIAHGDSIDRVSSDAARNAARRELGRVPQRHARRSVLALEEEPTVRIRDRLRVSHLYASTLHDRRVSVSDGVGCHAVLRAGLASSSRCMARVVGSGAGDDADGAHQARDCGALVHARCVLRRRLLRDSDRDAAPRVRVPRGRALARARNALLVERDGSGEEREHHVPGSLARCRTRSSGTAEQVPHEPSRTRDVRPA